MSRFQEDARLTRLQALLQCTETACAMRVEQVMLICPNILHSFGYLFVRISSTAYLGRDSCMATAIEVEHTGKVTRIAHIHGIGYRSDAGSRRINTRLQILIEYVVTVVGCYETLYRQSHAFTEQTGRYITEIAAWHTDYGIGSLTRPLQLRISIKIVESLRQETCHINGVGAGKLQTAVKLLVHESRFHQCLTIVERTVYFKSRDILSQRSELLFLDFTDLALRVEHINMNTFYTEETIGNGTARITRGSNQYINLLLTLFSNKIAQQARHKTAAHILKGKCRAMEQFEGIDIFRHFHQRDIEAQCIVHNLLQCICGNIFPKESIRHPIGYLLKAKRINAVVEFLRQRFNGKGHEKSFVCGKPFHYRLFEGNIGSLFVGTIILHIKLNIKELIIKGYDAVPNDNQHIWACHLIIPS